MAREEWASGGLEDRIVPRVGCVAKYSVLPAPRPGQPVKAEAACRRVWSSQSATPLAAVRHSV
eukprot:2530271-Pyramimonas_sp.AAC.1